MVPEASAEEARAVLREVVSDEELEEAWEGSILRTRSAGRGRASRFRDREYPVWRSGRSTRGRQAGVSSVSQNGQTGRASPSWLRVSTALVGAPIVLGAAYLGGYWFTGLILIIALVSMFEVHALFTAAGLRPFTVVSFVLAAAVVLRFSLPGWNYATALVGAGTLAAIPFMRGDRIPERAAVTLFIVAYPAWLLSFLLAVRDGIGIARPDGLLMRVTILLFFLVWASDTFAYYSGKLMGTRPFFPSISPKKTWEGFWGGLAGTYAVAVLAKTLDLIPLNWTDTFVLAAIVAVFGPIGDLVESRIKRAFDVKDSGSILPGHGGVLDRFDAMLLCAPVIWLYLALVWG